MPRAASFPPKAVSGSTERRLRSAARKPKPQSLYFQYVPYGHLSLRPPPQSIPIQSFHSVCPPRGSSSRWASHRTNAGTGRVIPLNDTVMITLEAHAARYIRRFGECEPEWYVFPAGKGQPTDPTRTATSLKTAWIKVQR
jgi:hypothetical protein